MGQRTGPRRFHTAALRTDWMGVMGLRCGQLGSEGSVPGTGRTALCLSAQGADPRHGSLAGVTGTVATSQRPRRITPEGCAVMEGQLALAMFVAVCAILLLGFPVALTLGGTALGFAALGILIGHFDPDYLTLSPVVFSAPWETKRWWPYRSLS